MRQFHPIRSLVLGLAATSMVAVGFAAPASAATPATCTKATFATNLKTFKSTSQVTGCTNSPAPAMTIVANFKNLANIQTTITWKNGAGKNGPFKVTQKQVKKPNKCKFETVKGKKVQDTLIVSTGKVTSGTGKAAKLKGTTFSERLCVTQKTTTYLEPGSKIIV